MTHTVAETRRAADAAYHQLIAAYNSAARRYELVEPAMQPMAAREAARAAWDLHWHFRQLPWHMRGRTLCGDVWCYIATRWEARQGVALESAS